MRGITATRVEHTTPDGDSYTMVVCAYCAEHYPNRTRSQVTVHVARLCDRCDDFIGQQHLFFDTTDTTTT